MAEDRPAGGLLKGLPSNMRILYLHQYFNLPSDPGGTRSYEMARRLVEAGHDVFMITTDRFGRCPGKGWQITKESGIDVHWLPLPYDNRMSYPLRIKVFFQFAIKAGICAALIPADVVFATSTPLTIAIPGVFSAKFQRIPMVFEVRDLWPELPIALGVLKGIMIPPARWLERFAYRNAEKVVALSPTMKEGVVRAGCADERVSVIPNSSDVELFGVSKEACVEFRASHEWLQNRSLVLYGGTLGMINGVSWLAEMAAEVMKIDPTVRFLVVGDGAERERVRHTAERLGVLWNNFFMMDPVPKREMPAILSAASVAISLFIDLPEMWANSANKFFDAIAAGRPVAINYAGWQAELLWETGAGLVLPVGDIPGSARMLIDFLADPDRVNKASRAARKLAETHFNRDHLARKLEYVLQEAVADYR